MAKFLSTLVANAAFLLLWIVLVSASTEQQKIDDVAAISPSLEQVASPQDTNICGPNDVYNSEIWRPTQDCNICTFYCAGVCSGMGTKQVKKACTPRRRYGEAPSVFCQCCCAKPRSPPPPPPSPPPPTPSGGECQDGDTESETTLITSNCADCTNWCKEECADLGAVVVNDKCAIGESKFVRRCKCCCRASSCPTLGCPADVTWTVPGVLPPCKYKLISSFSSLPSSGLSM
ncbi:hypothetical protein C5167_007338 [Papaver somniferum]|uniref:uncharacterized protein LOC113344280 n=1 Tax=Papaver somniferum TaxID=3469 RepID=UPI000E6FE6EA|nr:uncharacterized protein LOC113344280 [Papaver somniferum]RZC93526.1 hypothetical protein C5167_007338 [Papaver somniferum]